MSLHADEISVAYAGREVLSRVGFFAGTGTVAGIIGRNGSGKSTLLRVVAGVLRANTGSVFYGSNNISGTSARDLASLRGYQGQLIPSMSGFCVREVVAMGLAHRQRLLLPPRDGDELVDKALAAFELMGLSLQDFAKLSGGEQQLTLLARTLVSEPGILILDEPMSALDLGHQAVVLEKLRALAQKGTTVVVALHDLNLASRFCDTLTLLHRGGVHATGTPEMVLRREVLTAVYGSRVEMVSNDSATAWVLPAFEHRD